VRTPGFRWNRILDVLGVKGALVPDTVENLQPTLTAGDAREVGPQFLGPRGDYGGLASNAAGSFACVTVQPRAEGGCVIEDVRLQPTTAGATFWAWDFLTAQPTFTASVLPANRQETPDPCTAVVTIGRVNPVAVGMPGNPFIIATQGLYQEFWRPLYVPNGRIWALQLQSGNVVANISVRVRDIPTARGGSA